MDKWFYAFIGLFIVLIGGTLNVIVMDANECEMPIKAGEHMSNSCYVAFSESSEVNYAFLGDVIIFTLGNTIHYISIGDILAISGGLFLTYILVLIAIQFNKAKKIEKNIKTK